MSWRSKNNAAVAEGRVAATRLILIKPMAYMNKSGLPVKDILGFYKALPQQMIVAHDDIDLNVGKVKVKMGGGHGGHNGLRDIDRHLGQDYRRIKIGVGRAPFATPSDKQVDTHVLSDFRKDELQTWVNPIIDCIAAEITRLFGDDNNDFMTAVARLCPPPAISTQDNLSEE